MNRTFGPLAAVAIVSALAGCAGAASAGEGPLEPLTCCQRQSKTDPLAASEI